MLLKPRPDLLSGSGQCLCPTGGACCVEGSGGRIFICREFPYSFSSFCCLGEWMQNLPHKGEICASRWSGLLLDIPQPRVLFQIAEGGRVCCPERSSAAVSEAGFCNGRKFLVTWGPSSDLCWYSLSMAPKKLQGECLHHQLGELMVWIRQPIFSPTTSHCKQHWSPSSGVMCRIPQGFWWLRTVTHIALHPTGFALWDVSSQYWPHPI